MPVDNLLSGHEALGPPLDEARQILERVAKVIARHWRSLEKEVGMSRRDADYYATAFQHEEMRNALRRN